MRQKPGISKRAKQDPTIKGELNKCKRIILLTERNGLTENMTAFQEWMLIYTEIHITIPTMAKISLVQITIIMVCSLIRFK